MVQSLAGGFYGANLPQVQQAVRVDWKGKPNMQTMPGSENSGDNQVSGPQEHDPPGTEAGRILIWMVKHHRLCLLTLVARTAEEAIQVYRSWPWWNAVDRRCFDELDGTQWIYRAIGNAIDLSVGTYIDLNLLEANHL